MSEQENPTQPGITVTGGPLMVHGGVPMVRASLVTEEKHPVAWNVHQDVDTAEHAQDNGDVWLCRCGQSKTKPFCDLTHREIGFDGTPNHPEGSYADRANVMPGTGVVVEDDRAICAHTGFCAKHRDNVWKMVGRTEDEAVREEMKGMIDRCPSGALRHRPDQDSEPAEPDLPVRIMVENDGPYVVTGGVPLEIKGGEPVETRPRMSLCRCGASAIKPLCDGSHTKVGFTDS